MTLKQTIPIQNKCNASTSELRLAVDVLKANYPDATQIDLAYIDVDISDPVKPVSLFIESSTDKPGTGKVQEVFRLLDRPIIG